MSDTSSLRKSAEFHWFFNLSLIIIPQRTPLCENLCNSMVKLYSFLFRFPLLNCRITHYISVAAAVWLDTYQRQLPRDIQWNHPSKFILISESWEPEQIFIWILPICFEFLFGLFFIFYLSHSSLCFPQKRENVLKHKFQNNIDQNLNRNLKIHYHFLLLLLPFEIIKRIAAQICTLPS